MKQYETNWYLGFTPLFSELAYNFTVLLNVSREKTGIKLRNEMCNSGVCNQGTQECAPIVCGKNTVCEDEPLDTEYTLTVQEMYKKIRRSGVSRVSGSILLSISLQIMLQWILQYAH